MRAMKTNLLAMAVPVALAASLSACSGGGGSPGAEPPPVVGNTGPGFTPTVATDSTLTATTPPAVPAQGAPIVFPNSAGIPLNVIHANESLGMGAKGAGVTIGVLDSGVRRDHPSLAGRVDYNGFYLDPATNNANVDYVVDHGTEVAETAAGRPFGAWPGGVAQDAHIVSGRFISDTPPVDDGSGQGNGASFADATDFANFINAAYGDLANHGARIINNSWGGIYFTDPAGANAMGAGFQDFIGNRNGLVVFANGNYGNDARYVANPSDTSSLPTLAPSLGLEKGWLTVAALDPDNPTQLLSFSQQCGRAMNYCLSAPGRVVVTGAADTATNITYWNVYGTSFSAPLVSGAAAVVWSQFPYFNNDQVRQTLLGTATDMGAPGVDTVFGYGILNVGKAANGPGQFNWGDFSVSFTGNSVWRNAISGAGGLIKDGPGTLTLTAPQTFTGATQVRSGALDVRGVLASRQVTISPGARLYGGSAFYGNVTNNGTVFTNQAVATTVRGNYVQSAGANLGVWFGSPLLVNGTATLQGGQLSILGTQPNYTTSSKETVLHADGGLTGTFAKLAAAPNVFLDATLGYDASNAFLNINRVSVTAAAASMGLSSAAQASAPRVESAMTAIDAGNASAAGLVTGAGAIQQSPTAAVAERTLASLSGQLHASAAALTFESLDSGRRALSDRFSRLADDPARLAGAWTQDLERNGLLSQSGFSTLGYEISGSMQGSDWRIGRNGIAGMAVSRTQGAGWLSDLGDRTQGRQSEAQAYAGWLGARGYLQGDVGAGRFDRIVQRNLQLGVESGAVSTTLRGSYAFANVEGGYRFGFASLHVTPYAGTQYARVGNGGFNESGMGGFGLESDGWTTQRWQGYAGLRAGREWRFGHWTIGLDARGEWQRQLAASNTLQARFTGIDQWLPVTGMAMARSGRLFGLGLGLASGRGSMFRFDLSQRSTPRGDSRGVMAQYSQAF